MAHNATLVIIKPNAVEDNNIGHILQRFEQEGLRVAAMKMVRPTKEHVEGFYIEHKERPFFGPLIAFMVSGPFILLVLEGHEAITRTRKLIGSTDPALAEPNTLRKLYARSVIANAVHASDSEASAEREITYFFSPSERFPRFNE